MTPAAHNNAAREGYLQFDGQTVRRDWFHPRTGAELLLTHEENPVESWEAVAKFETMIEESGGVLTGLRTPMVFVPEVDQDSE